MDGDIHFKGWRCRQCRMIRIASGSLPIACYCAWLACKCYFTACIVSVRCTLQRIVSSHGGRLGVWQRGCRGHKRLGWVHRFLTSVTAKVFAEIWPQPLNLILTQTWPLHLAGQKLGLPHIMMCGNQIVRRFTRLPALFCRALLFRFNQPWLHHPWCQHEHSRGTHTSPWFVGCRLRQASNEGSWRWQRFLCESRSGLSCRVPKWFFKLIVVDFCRCFKAHSLILVITATQQCARLRTKRRYKIFARVD